MGKRMSMMIKLNRFLFDRVSEKSNGKLTVKNESWLAATLSAF
jgi:hypothetical protein